MSEKLLIHAKRQSTCCRANQLLVRSREGGFVTQNCEVCATPIDMKTLCLETGKTFVWDGERFFCPTSHMVPTVKEIRLLAELLQSDGDCDLVALAKCLNKRFERVAIKTVRKPGTRHALEWIGKDGRFFRRMGYRDLRVTLHAKMINVRGAECGC